ncbi:MAG: TonB-dependent receptor domain-containing protein, partial [Pyrinomonadaceae bacterium]
SGYNTTNFFTRVDHNLNDSNLLTGRYNIYTIESPNARTVGGINAISRGTSLDNRDQTLALNEVAILSSDSINELRFQYTRSRLLAPPNDLTGPAINILGTASLGTATFSPTARAIDLYELSDALTKQAGAHSLKVGADFLLNRIDIEFPGSIQGVYTFSSLANFLTGNYLTFQQAFGTPSQFQSNPNLGLFVQDEWRASKDLTINAGLRYDAQFLPDPIQTDSNNFAPRVGLAYAPGRHKTVVRANFGIYFERIPLRATSNALQRDGSKYNTAVFSFGQAGAPVFPDILPSFPPNLLASVTQIDPEIKNSYSEQANLQIEREIDKSTSLSVSYQHLRGLHLILSRNVNVPTLSALQAAQLGVPNLGRPDARFANISRFESSGDSYFDGMTISFNRRFERGASVRLSYTLSKAIDTAGNFFFSTPQDNSNLRGERGLSDNDQRHKLTLSGQVEVP